MLALLLELLRYRVWSKVNHNFINRLLRPPQLFLDTLHKFLQEQPTDDSLSINELGDIEFLGVHSIQLYQGPLEHPDRILSRDHRHVLFITGIRRRWLE